MEGACVRLEDSRCACQIAKLPMRANKFPRAEAEHLHQSKLNSCGELEYCTFIQREHDCLKRVTVVLDKVPLLGHYPCVVSCPVNQAQTSHTSLENNLYDTPMAIRGTRFDSDLDQLVHQSQSRTALTVFPLCISYAACSISLAE